MQPVIIGHFLVVIKALDIRLRSIHRIEFNYVETPFFVVDEFRVEVSFKQRGNFFSRPLSA